MRRTPRRRRRVARGESGPAGGRATLIPCGDSRHPPPGAGASRRRTARLGSSGATVRVPSRRRRAGPRLGPRMRPVTGFRPRPPALRLPERRGAA